MWHFDVTPEDARHRVHHFANGWICVRGLDQSWHEVDLWVFGFNLQPI